MIAIVVIQNVASRGSTLEVIVMIILTYSLQYHPFLIIKVNIIIYLLYIHIFIIYIGL